MYTGKCLGDFYFVYKGIPGRFLHCIQGNAWGDFYIVYKGKPGRFLLVVFAESGQDLLYRICLIPVTEQRTVQYLRTCTDTVAKEGKE